MTVFDDIIDVRVTEAFARETLSHRPLDRHGRHAMQESAAALLVPDLERVARHVIEQTNYRMPAIEASAKTIEAALAKRLRDLGVDDIFTVAVKLTEDERGVPAFIELWLGPTDAEREQFGFFTSEQTQGCTP
jgi:hypothetical protein